jgi:hypothetical protein
MRATTLSLCLSLSLPLACERPIDSTTPPATNETPASTTDASTPDASTPDASTPDTSTSTTPPPARQLTSVDVSALYWASPTNDGRSRIDVIDLPDVEALYALADAHGDPDGTSAAFPAALALPGGHAIGDEWVVATSEGERRAKSVAYGGYGGASEFHFIVVLDAPLQGLTARASAWTGSAPRVREVEPQSMDQGEVTAMFERIAPGIVASADEQASRVLQRKPLMAAHATAVAGSFPGGFTHLVSVVRPLRPNDIEIDRVAGLFLADASGRILAISPLTVTMYANEVESLVDIEGDGVDEVLFTNSYYEGSYLVFMSWDAEGKPLMRTLDGDGA